MKPLTSVAISLIFIAVIVAFTARVAGVGQSGDTVTVIHWTNGHLMRPGLLPDMATAFNRAEHRTADGKRIVVKVYQVDSFAQVEDLSSRVLRGVPANRAFPDPTILSTSADHWLVSGNYAAGRTLVDLSKAKSVATTWIGIVTYRDMAECLGWPNKEIGYADIVALRNDPRGWAAYPCAKAEWGQQPLVAYTDPTTSSTGRSVLYSLYSIAAGKPIEQLSVADVNDPKVVAYVKAFQGLVDHYMTGTLPLNTKVYQGPRYGHFFLIPEDNLVDLYHGTTAFIDGDRVEAPPIKRSMVMIYPKEGSAVHNHSASIVEAPWITPDLTDAAGQWVDYLRADAQQRKFMSTGLRPGTNIPLGDPINGQNGLDPAKPSVKLNPDRIDQAAAGAIMAAWDEVKRPGIVTWVVDTSGSMQGTKIKQAKDGMIGALDSMAQNNQVGFVSFAGVVEQVSHVGPLSSGKFTISNTVERLQANGNTALYDAIKRGVEMSDEASGDESSIRAVVVLTDGKANAGQFRLDDIVKMSSRAEVAIKECRGYEGDLTCIDVQGARVPLAEITGSGLALKTAHKVQIFFIGIGDADLQVGRILSEATGAEFQGATEKDLAKVLQEFSKYF